MLISREITFEAAMALPTVYEGRTHGHSYRLRVMVEGDIQEDGMVVDFDQLHQILLEKVHAKLDHRNLDEVMRLPSVENLCWWIWDQLEKDLNLFEVKLWDTDKSAAILRREDILRTSRQDRVSKKD